MLPTGRVVSIVLVLVLALPALADGGEGEPVPDQTVSAEVEAPARNWINVRLGASTSTVWPHVCGEVTPLEVLNIKTYGNGAGF